MSTYSFPVKWTMVGNLEVEAKDENTAYQLAKELITQENFAQIIDKCYLSKTLEIDDE